MSLQNRPSNNKQIKHLTILTKLCTIQMKLLTLGYQFKNEYDAAEHQKQLPRFMIKACSSFS